ncbi:lysylphosphatidylglycerol synthase transmembrane domain-containing protein [Nocardia huaxiensis]|uniref:Flippase-like domain-containing protein n=1 Tax=Nocardia huaxiensis TaxID=2755382 RepID=A0A7D6VGE7_9NOCA|nr:lysylphosphatidylglycerol synthase domain-containing protein [Nocardia huaxiensis]QLY29536.1 flippase-like domain-containing protein [Nocardia huaxiensis]UFS96904.1 flippase-like domain-containing protein [Nocardia huaxiensis]
MATATPAAARRALPTVRKALPTLVVTVAVTAAVVWQWEAVAEGIATLLAADPRWLALALLATLALWPTSVLMLRGSIPQETCSRRLFALQLAFPAIGLIPAANLLIRLRFLRREGLSHSAALASITLFGFAAFVVRIPLVLIAVLATPSLMSRTGAQPPWHDLGARTSDTWHGLLENPWRTAAIAVGVLLLGGAVLIAAAVFLYRRFVARGGWRAALTRLREARANAAAAWKSVAATALRPRRAAALWLCALLQPLLMVLALWAVLQAVGAHMPLTDAFVVHLVTVALAPLLPSPNGVATKELTLAAGLTAVAGLAGGVAVAAVLGFRLLTFWSQIPLGIASFAWLSHRRAV